MREFVRERAIVWAMVAGVITFLVYLFLLLRPIDLSFVERLAIENCEEIERMKETRLETPLRDCDQRLPYIRRRVPLPVVGD